MERLKTEKHVVGLKQSVRAVEEDKASLAFVARDADYHVVFPFENLCREKNIQIEYVNNIKELGKACHVEVPTAVAVLLR
ncbi:MAG: ribosomal L7Ae/L30e/S12e/Gadd45 family protein [Clostridia bacterium]|nr:ribosomal L7Ae/L30e/S12e/Gadd45 family protein [Clostridia bacterium]